MNRTILSLAIIKAHWEKNKADYIDNFIPLIASLLNEKNYSEVDLELFQSDFKERYGLQIPINALVTIFNRANKNKIVYREQGKIFVYKDRISDFDISLQSTDVERKFNNITNAIQLYAKATYELEITKPEIEEALLSFLKEHDLDILFAAKDRSVLPEVKSTKKLKYIISTFSINAFENDPQLFQFLLDVSVGHALSGAILYSELNSFSGKLKNLNIYFDTPIILSLMGLNGKYKKKSVAELFSILNDEGANLFILETTRGEIDSILSDCHKWLEKGSYDLEKSSKILRYCHRNGISASDVESKILKLDQLLLDNKVTSTRVPNYNENQFVIDENQLEKTILDTYRNIIDNFDTELADRKGTISRDVKVLSGIYRFREGHKPKTIKDSKALFITSNTALAFASKRFESLHNGSSFTIPTCLTDVFLGTVIWLQSPQKVETINSKRFMSDCYSAIQPTEALIKKYLQEIEKLKTENRISNDEYYLLRSHRASLNLLEAKTMGDPDAFDASSTEEILDNIVFSIKAKEAERLNLEIQEHTKTKEQLEIEQERVEKIDSTLKKKSTKIASLIGKFIFYFLSFVVLICLAINLFPEYFPVKQSIKIPLWSIIIVVTVLNIATGFNFGGLRNKIVDFIQKKIYNWLKE